jgi:hypothetical protein
MVLLTLNPSVVKSENTPFLFSPVGEKYMPSPSGKDGMGQKPEMLTLNQPQYSINVQSLRDLISIKLRRSDIFIDNEVREYIRSSAGAVIDCLCHPFGIWFWAWSRFFSF